MEKAIFNCLFGALLMLFVAWVLFNCQLIISAFVCAIIGIVSGVAMLVLILIEVNQS